MQRLWRRILTVLIIFICNGIILSQWSSDPTVNNPICTASDRQEYTTICSDGSGGAIIVWEDLRNSGTTNYDIYTQRINSSGSVEWTSNGVVICDAANRQLRPQIVADGSGGAIITWEDERTGGSNPDVYVQKINSNGVTQWTDDGIAIATGNYYQSSIQLVSDGSGGAILTWEDYRNSNSDIFAYRIESDGTSSWSSGGEVICSQTSNQQVPKICSDGSGGAIITWYDWRDNGSTSRDIYAQKINSSGTTQWTANGVAVCNESQLQEYPEIDTDGAGGAIITWEDYRNSNYDVYAQRVRSSDGAKLWYGSGVSITTASGNQRYPKTVNNDGNVYISWYDGDIFVHCIKVADGSGLTGNWAANGTAVCGATNTQSDQAMISDNQTGVFISWTDKRNGGVEDIYAQRVLVDASMSWSDDGIAVCSKSSSQTLARLCPDASNGAIIAWQDLRNGNLDIYASNVNSDGELPVELVWFSAEVIANNILLKWQTATEVNNYGFNVERSIINSQFPQGAGSIMNWTKIGFVEGNGTTNSPKQYEFIDNDPPSGHLQYRLKQIDLDGTYKYYDLIAEVDVAVTSIDEETLPTEYSLSQNYPNPFNPSTTISFSIPNSRHGGQAQFVTLKVFDTLGNEIATLVNETKAPGYYEINVDAFGLSSGTYFYTLTAGSLKETKKMLFVK